MDSERDASLPANDAEHRPDATAHSGSDFEWLTPHGAMAARIREMDWAATALGPVTHWPQSLRTAINVVLASEIPMYVWWGPENINIYNDAYVPIVGAQRHPAFFGRPAIEMWPEIWPTMQGFLDHVRTAREAVCSEDLLFKLERNGYPENCYFTFSFNPAFDEEGQVHGAIAIVQETTSKFLALEARDRADRATHVARQELYDFFMQAPAPMVILLGPEHRFALANPLYEKFVGRHVQGKSVYEAFSREEVSEFVAQLDSVYRTGEPYIGHDLPLTIPDDSGAMQHLYIDVMYQPFRAPDGNIKGVLAFHQDVTKQVLARKRAEQMACELQAAVQSRDEFLSIASHEMKTPITVLSLRLQEVQRHLGLDPTESPETQRFGKMVKSALRQTDRLTSLVEDLLDVSRIQAGKLLFTLEEVDAAPMIADVLEQFREQAKVAGCTLSMDVLPDLVGKWDRARIEQVFVNLLSNAIKYAPGEPIEIHGTSDGNLATFTVQDHGPGIPPDRQGRIFERFERASPSRNISGLGLGLYIARQIVLGHLGEIHLESRPSQGARFVVQLPLQVH